MMMLTQDELRRLLNYDAETGRFSWRVRHVRAEIGGEPGSVRKDGYARVQIRRHRYYLHRLAWFYVYGVWPAGDLDHINGDPSDNRIANLRESTHAENIRNGRRRKNNKTGFKGVYLHAPGRWRTRITVSGRVIDLGVYETPEEAHAVYCKAAEYWHGRFANTGVR